MACSRNPVRFKVKVLEEMLNPHKLIYGGFLYAGKRIDDYLIEKNDSLFLGAKNKLRYAEDFYNLEVEKVFHGNDNSIPKKITSTLISILAEALTNSAKYSKEKKIKTTINVEENLVSVAFEDFGVGFEQGSNSQGTGRGLANMHTQFVECGGEINIQSAAGEGVTIFIKIPWEG